MQDEDGQREKENTRMCVYVCVCAYLSLNSRWGIRVRYMKTNLLPRQILN